MFAAQNGKKMGSKSLDPLVDKWQLEVPNSIAATMRSSKKKWVLLLSIREFGTSSNVGGNNIVVSGTKNRKARESAFLSKGVVKSNQKKAKQGSSTTSGGGNPVGGKRKAASKGATVKAAIPARPAAKPISKKPPSKKGSNSNERPGVGTRGKLVRASDQLVVGRVGPSSKNGDNMLTVGVGAAARAQRKMKALKLRQAAIAITNPFLS